MSFGDGLNDCTMIEAAGVGVAMENACDEVKMAADFITSSNDDDGVARAIYEFIR
jgi:hydroxymethylpyrimidine pyrophosphatase-like HAD family hydrolase